jgi:hypothetical protein
MAITSHSALKLIALLSTAVALGSTVVLAPKLQSGQDLVLLRNALIAQERAAGIYEWTPTTVPEDFESETRPTPGSLQRFADRATFASKSDDDFGKALALAAALSRNQSRGRGPIQSDTVTALQLILSEGSGYCADYTQVFNAVGRAAGLAVREWGMSFSGYGGDGHAFNEVWDRGLGQWVFIDPFFSFYVTDRSNRPISASQFREALLDGSAHRLTIMPVDAEKFGFKSPEAALRYYQRGAPRFFMIWGNNVLSYDAAPVVRAFESVSRSAGQAAAIVTGEQPRLVIPADFADRTALEELSRLRRIMFTAGIAMLVALAALVFVRLGRK